MDADACFWAAEGGHLGVLKWARTNGCEWDAGVIEIADAPNNKHESVLIWARANGCPEPASQSGGFKFRNDVVMRRFH